VLQQHTNTTCTLFDSLALLVCEKGEHMSDVATHESSENAALACISVSDASCFTTDLQFGAQLARLGDLHCIT